MTTFEILGHLAKWNHIHRYDNSYEDIHVINRIRNLEEEYWYYDTVIY